MMEMKLACSSVSARIQLLNSEDVKDDLIDLLHPPLYADRHWMTKQQVRELVRDVVTHTVFTAPAWKLFTTRDGRLDTTKLPSVETAFNNGLDDALHDNFNVYLRKYTSQVYVIYNEFKASRVDEEKAMQEALVPLLDNDLPTWTPGDPITALIVTLLGTWLDDIHNKDKWLIPDRQAFANVATTIFSERGPVKCWDARSYNRRAALAIRNGGKYTRELMHLLVATIACMPKGLEHKELTACFMKGLASVKQLSGVKFFQKLGSEAEMHNGPDFKNIMKDLKARFEDFRMLIVAPKPAAAAYVWRNDNNYNTRLHFMFYVALNRQELYPFWLSDMQYVTLPIAAVLNAFHELFQRNHTLIADMAFNHVLPQGFKSGECSPLIKLNVEDVQHAVRHLATHQNQPNLKDDYTTKCGIVNASAYLTSCIQRIVNSDHDISGFLNATFVYAPDLWKGQRLSAIINATLDGTNIWSGKDENAGLETEFFPGRQPMYTAMQRALCWSDTVDVEKNVADEKVVVRAIAWQHLKNTCQGKIVVDNFKKSTSYGEPRASKVYSTLSQKGFFRK